jgi:type IV pilus assembly protein PilV
MGLLALAGLQATMISNTTSSKYRADASYLVQQRLGMIWADPANAAVFSTDAALDDISNLLPNGVRTVTDLGGGQVRIVITWQEPGSPDVHNVTTDARVNL